MSIYSLEAATSFGALDYDAMSDGVPLDANRARTMVRQANRLIRKRHQLLNLVWPSRQDDGQYRVEMLGNTDYDMLLAPLSIRKKPGLTKADIYMRVLVPSGRSLDLAFITLGQSNYRQQQVSHAGTGAWANVTRELTLDPGPVEALTILARMEGQGSLMDEGVYVGPNSEDMTDYAVNFDHLSSVNSPQPTWNEIAIAQAGHYIEFKVRNQLLSRRRILGAGNTVAGNNHSLRFEPFARYLVRDENGYLNEAPFHAVMHGFDPDPAQNTWEIRVLTWWGLAQVLVVAQERAL
jgi:hypothetical protein